MKKSSIDNSRAVAAGKNDELRLSTAPEHRLILPLCSKGSLGKSLVIHTIAWWYASIEWQGFDLDAENRTFSRTFPGKVELVPDFAASQIDGFVWLSNRLDRAPITLVDPRAHLDLLDCIERTGLLALAPDLGLAITVVLFPVDDQTVMEYVDRAYDVCRDQVDYLVVHNQYASRRLRMYDNSALESDLNSCGAVRIQLPPLSELVKRAMARHETREKSISFADAPGLLDPMLANLLASHGNDVFRQLDACADKLLTPNQLEEFTPRGVISRNAPAPRWRGGRTNLND